MGARRARTRSITKGWHSTECRARILLATVPDTMWPATVTKRLLHTGTDDARADWHKITMRRREHEVIDTTGDGSKKEKTGGDMGRRLRKRRRRKRKRSMTSKREEDGGGLCVRNLHVEAGEKDMSNQVSETSLPRCSGHGPCCFECTCQETSRWYLGA